MESFLKWISSQGVTVEHLEVFEFSDMGRGLRATKDIKVLSFLLTEKAIRNIF
jgi:hypothetical protein